MSFMPDPMSKALNALMALRAHLHFASFVLTPAEPAKAAT